MAEIFESRVMSKGKVNKVDSQNDVHFWTVRYTISGRIKKNYTAILVGTEDTKNSVLMVGSGSPRQQLAGRPQPATDSRSTQTSQMTHNGPKGLATRA